MTVSIDGELMTVTVPPGLKSGQRFRFQYAAAAAEPEAGAAHAAGAVAGVALEGGWRPASPETTRPAGAAGGARIPPQSPESRAVVSAWMAAEERARAEALAEARADEEAVARAAATAADRASPPMPEAYAEQPPVEGRYKTLPVEAGSAHGVERADGRPRTEVSRRWETNPQAMPRHPQGSHPQCSSPGWQCATRSQPASPMKPYGTRGGPISGAAQSGWPEHSPPTHKVPVSGRSPVRELDFTPAGSAADAPLADPTTAGSRATPAATPSSSQKPGSSHASRARFISRAARRAAASSATPASAAGARGGYDVDTGEPSQAATSDAWYDGAAYLGDSAPARGAPPPACAHMEREARGGGTRDGLLPWGRSAQASQEAARVHADAEARLRAARGADDAGRAPLLDPSHPRSHRSSAASTPAWWQRACCLPAAPANRPDQLARESTDDVTEDEATDEPRARTELSRRWEANDNVRPRRPAPAHAAWRRAPAADDVPTAVRAYAPVDLASAAKYAEGLSFSAQLYVSGREYEGCHTLRCGRGRCVGCCFGYSYNCVLLDDTCLCAPSFGYLGCPCLTIDAKLDANGRRAGNVWVGGGARSEQRVMIVDAERRTLACYQLGCCGETRAPCVLCEKV